MKKVFVIVFLFIVFIGIIGYAAKLENKNLDTSPVVQQAVSDNLFTQTMQDTIKMDQQLLIFGLLLGAGLVGLLIVRRK